MDSILDFCLFNKCNCYNTFNCIDIINCKNKHIIFKHFPLLSIINDKTKTDYLLDSNKNTDILEPELFKTLLDFIIKFNVNYNNNNIDTMFENRIIYLLSIYMYIIKNLDIIDSFYIIHEYLIVYLYTSLKYNILNNITYITRMTVFFNKYFKNNNECLNILFTWCNTFENLIHKYINN